MIRRAAALLLAALLCAPACAMAQDALAVSDAARTECTAAGGRLLDTPRAVRVASPYGTPTVVLRDAPSDSYGAVTVLMVEQEVTVIGETDAFYFVLLGDGVTGWLESDEVK